LERQGVGAAAESRADVRGHVIGALVVVARGAQIAPAAALSLVQALAQQQRIGGVALKSITQWRSKRR